MAAGPVQVNAESWGFPRVPPPDELCRRAAHAQRLRHALEDGGTRPSSTQAWPAGDIMQGGSAHHGIDGSAPPPSLSSGQAADGAAASDRAAEAVHGTAGAAGQREVQPCPPGVGDAREGQQQHAQPDLRHPGPLLHTAFLDALDSSRAFRSPHCEGEQAKALGAQARTPHQLPCLAQPQRCPTLTLPFTLFLTWAGLLGWAGGLGCFAVGSRGAGGVPEGCPEAENQPSLVN